MNCFLVVVIEPPEPNGLLFRTQSHQNLGSRMGEGLLEASWGCEGYILKLPSSWPGLKALFSSPFLEATFEVEETPCTLRGPPDLSSHAPSQHTGPGSCLPLHSPLGTPRVLHDPIGCPIFFSIPNSQDCVVYFIWSFMTGSTGK